MSTGPTRRKIAFFGHFGAGNLGNESTLQAMLCHVRRLIPDVELTCICTAPETVASDYKIAAVPISSVVFKPWTIRNPVARFVRKLFIGIPSELYRWIQGLKMLSNTDALIVPGTGLLTDAFSLVGWGPYSTFKWSMIAKLCRCRLFFVSVGAGPLNGTAGRFLAKSALSLADFRSYRDGSTLQYVQDIGFRRDDDRVYPDLAFSLPETLLPHHQAIGRRLVVGLGLMEYPGMYSVEKPTSADYGAYLETLVEFVKWLLAREYDIRLLIGDFVDRSATREFRSLLRERSVTYDQERIIDEPIESVEDLLSQLAATDIVVGTRFHNVLLSLLLNKPSIAISFHHKCSSLMSQMGLSEYCQDIKQLDADKLIEQFCQLEKNTSSLKHTIGERVADCRGALEEQYRLIFRDLFAG
ncbi:MAG TPA: polysaccharide pyruvyl transferase family protein [Candidatus Sulfotelmatobacter sp.]|nr:polysaccharide pyruvyl transferase family protein [Candidatus Sulfotelmatobacter sp.]